MIKVLACLVTIICQSHNQGLVRVVSVFAVPITHIINSEAEFQRLRLSKRLIHDRSRDNNCSWRCLIKMPIKEANLLAHSNIYVLLRVEVSGCLECGKSKRSSNKAGTVWSKINEAGITDFSSGRLAVVFQNYGNRHINVYRCPSSYKVAQT